ncbi:MAG: AMP-binding protein [Ilumatobacteraceae bacterium]
MIRLRFWSSAELSPDRIALVDPRGIEWTAGELLDASNAMVHSLRSIGMRTGDGLAVVLPNGTEMVVAYLAAMQAGWYLTPINHHLVGHEIAHILQDCEAKVLIAHERFATQVCAAVEALGGTGLRCYSIGEIEGFEPIKDLLADAPRTKPDHLEAGTVMYYTSGTTGRPKGVRRPLPGTHPEDATVPFADMLALLGIESHPDDVHLCGSPLYHTAVLAFAASALHTGQTVVLMDKFTPAAMLDLIDRYRVTNSHMVPTQFHRLLSLSDDERAEFDISTLRYVIHGAAPCPPDVKRKIIEWWGPVVYEYYGTTEGGGTYVTSQDWLARPGTVGRPWLGADIKILDDDGNEVPPGTEGTVYILLGDAGFEYYKDESKTSASRIGDYFTVGDIGLLDEDGFLFLKDRSADLIIAGGVNIYPVEIENALLGHPAVGDVAVFGAPDPDLGERVVAVVEPTRGWVADDALRDALLEHCTSTLARFKVPRELTFSDALPRDPSGKLYKRKLREAYRLAATAPTA